MDTKIKIYINNKEEYINKYNHDRISPELDSYILTESKTIYPNKKVDIEITHAFNLSEKEKEKLINMIQLSYKDDIQEFDLLKDRVLIRDISIMTIGIVILSFYYILKTIPIISEFILIIGWVLIWESIYSLLFSRTENNLKISKRKQLINSNIVFIEKKNNK